MCNLVLQANYSVRVAAFGVGGLLGAILLLFVDVSRDRRHLCSWSAGAFGCILILAALNPWFWGLSVLLVAAGAAMSVSNISANTLLQANTTPQMRGKTVSLYMLAMRGGLSIGSLATGLSVNAVGVGNALFINGILAVLAQLVVAWFWFRSQAPD